MSEFDYLIVGGGLAAASAVAGVREVDGEGSIAVLSEEAEPPYHRPPLSKEYLQVPEATRDLLHVRPADWYESHEVELMLETSARSLDPREREVKTEDGETRRGNRILLATGGTPRELDLPGKELDAVFTLRTVEDAEAIRDAAQESEEALLVGAGFIGMELAASLTEFDVAPRVVEVEDRVWSRLLPSGLSERMQEYFEERSVRFHLGTSVERLIGEGRVEGAVLSDGSEVPCQMVVVGVGIGPNDALAEEAGLAVQDGVVVDAKGETSHGYIYATGDVARFPDPVFGDLVRVEHWDHAKTHGRVVGRNMAGADEEYDHLSYFFSDVFDLSLNVYGRPARSDQVVARGELGEEPTLVFCGSEGRVCASILVNANEAMEECQELVRRRPTMEALEDRLRDPEADLAEVGG